MPSLGPGIAALAARTNLCPEPSLRVYQRRQAVRVGPTRRFAAVSPPPIVTVPRILHLDTKRPKRDGRPRSISRQIQRCRSL